jgi:hypothetical protein
LAAVLLAIVESWTLGFFFGGVDTLVVGDWIWCHDGIAPCFLVCCGGKAIEDRPK